MCVCVCMRVHDWDQQIITVEISILGREMLLIYIVF